MEANTMIDLELRQWCVDVACAKKPTTGIVNEARKLYEWLKPYNWIPPAPKEQVMDFELRQWCALRADADDPSRQLEDEEKKLYEWITSADQQAKSE